MELAERAADLGYPMTRVAISKIEGNSRAGKLDVAELLVLAAVLHIPPALLLAPDFPDGKVETRPGHSVDSREAVAWFSGRGAELVAADALAVEAGKRLSQMRDSLARPDLTPENRNLLRADMAYTKNALEQFRENVKRAKAELWGGREVGSSE